MASRSTCWPAPAEARVSVAPYGGEGKLRRDHGALREERPDELQIRSEISLGDLTPVARDVVVVDGVLVVPHEAMNVAGARRAAALAEDHLDEVSDRELGRRRALGDVRTRLRLERRGRGLPFSRLEGGGNARPNPQVPTTQPIPAGVRLGEVLVPGLGVIPEIALRDQNQEDACTPSWMVASEKATSFSAQRASQSSRPALVRKSS